MNILGDELLNKIFNYKNFYEILAIVIGFIALVIISIYIYKEPTINPIDLTIRDAMYKFRGEKYGFWYFVFRLITEFGFFYFVVLIAIIVGISVRFDRRFWLLCIATLVTYVANESIKFIFLRERPIAELQWMHESSTSFPSGHSMVSVVFYGIIMYYIYDSLYFNAKQKKIWIASISVLILLIGFSRLVLGVHYFLDVLGGYAFGVVIVAIIILFYKVKLRLPNIEIKKKQA